MLNHDQTPRISWHALERCRQMGLSTKVPKQMWRHPSIVAPGDTPEMGDSTRDRVRVKSDTHPDYMVVVDVTDPQPVVVTVLFNLPSPYIRKGTTYETIQEN